MEEHIEIDRIINMSGIPKEELPSGDSATWGTLNAEYTRIIELIRTVELDMPGSALQLFAKLTVILKNEFYCDIASRAVGRNSVGTDDKSLAELVHTLETLGFGKTVMLGNYQNPTFIKMVCDWCDAHGYVALFPFSMGCSLENFIDYQIYRYVHSIVC